MEKQISEAAVKACMNIDKPYPESLAEAVLLLLGPIRAWARTLEDGDDNYAMVAEALVRDFESRAESIFAVVQRDVGKIEMMQCQWYAAPESARLAEPMAVNQ